MYAAYRLTYFVIIITSLLVYYGCSSSSGTSRYGNNSTESGSNNDSPRFSSANDDESDESLSEVSNYETEYTEDLPDDDEVDVSQLIESYKPYNSGSIDESGTSKEKMLMGIIKYLDTPYKYGGNSKKGIDCSAFTQNIYKSVLSIDLLRSARDQYTQGEIVANMDDLQFGDLVFFDTRSGSSPGHVGIYIGDELFAHASTKKGVTISSLTHSYYQSRFMGGRRIKTNGSF